MMNTYIVTYQVNNNPNQLTNNLVVRADNPESAKARAVELEALDHKWITNVMEVE